MIEMYKFMFSSGTVYAGTMFSIIVVLFLIGLIVAGTRPGRGE